MGPWLHNKYRSAEMTKIPCSSCQQKAEAAAQNTFSNPGSDLKVIIGYFIAMVVRHIDLFSFLHHLFTVYFKDSTTGFSNELGLEISM